MGHTGVKSFEVTNITVKAYGSYGRFFTVFKAQWCNKNAMRCLRFMTAGCWIASSMAIIELKFTSVCPTVPPFNSIWTSF